MCGSSNTNIAKALASTTGWHWGSDTCAVGNTPSSNNATGFGALPAGNRYDTYYEFGTAAYFWSATEYSSTNAYRRRLYYSNAGVNRLNGDKGYGYSVRCVKDEN